MHHGSRFILEHCRPIYGSGTIVDLTGQYLAGTQRQREIYLRNVFSPSVEYEFTKDGWWVLATPTISTRIRVIFPKIVVRTPSIQGLPTGFNIRNGVTLEYGYQIGNFDILLIWPVIWLMDNTPIDLTPGLPFSGLCLFKDGFWSTQNWLRC